MKAFGYPRVSTMSQDSSGYSLEEQVASIEAFCKQQGIELAAHFLEVESAATLKARPSFKAALKAVYNDPTIDAIIITNLDRFSRSVLDAEVVRQALARRGKRLISIQEQYLTPTAGVDPEYEMYLESAFQHRMVEAEAERKRIRRRSLTGKKAKQDAGGWIGFRPPFEYDVIQGDLVQNFERALILRHMRRLRNWLGWSYQKIADYLNAKEIAPPHARQSLKKRQRPLQKGNGKWIQNSVRNLLVTQRDWSDRRGILRENLFPTRRGA